MEYIYITLSNLNREFDGASKKIFSQVKSLKKHVMQVKCMYFINNQLYIDDLNLKKIRTRLNCYNVFKYFFSKIDSDQKVFYIRFFGFNLKMFLLVREIKKLNRTNKIVLEIPTYPYLGEQKNFKSKLLAKAETLYKPIIKKKIDYIVTFSEDKKIEGIKCINISNGVDLNEIKLKDKNIKNKESLIFTTVSNCEFWHGIDRFLYSLAEYGKLEDKKEIVFNIVGEGVETNNLKIIVLKNKYLSKIVKFQGFKTGKELEKVYNETDVAIGCLGNHRKGIYTIQALKNKEYMAKGLPMVFSEDDPGLRNKKFVFKASHDEKLIDIEELINWYKNLKITPEEIRENVKEFTWDKQMKKVIDNI